MKFIKKIVSVISVLTILSSCSTRKDTIVSRNWHSLNTKFNVLFNGKEAFKKGIDGINESYKDDWFEQLPIEPIKFEREKIDIPKFNNSIGAGFGDAKD